MRARTLQEFQDLIGSQIRRRIKGPLVINAKIGFQQALEDLLHEVRSHPVSKELVEHTHPSKFLRGSPGSLFGFFGFVKGDQPVEELLEYLKTEITLIPGSRINKAFQLPMRITLPGPQDFNNDGRFKLPWGKGLSWVVAVETGLSGLPHFLSVTHRQNKGRSVSGEGLQVESKLLKGQGYHGQKYLGQIFSKFRRRIVGR
jgi:hypothetical protein